MLFQYRTILLGILITVVQVIPTFAHNALLFVEDNGNGTIYIEAGVSTGEKAEGAKIVIRDKETSRPLSTFFMPDSGKINVPIPKAPYTVTLDLGPGHVVTKTGPFKADTGTSVAQQSSQKQNVSKYSATNRLLPLAAAGILIFITIVLLVASARLRKKTDEFLKRRPRP